MRMLVFGATGFGGFALTRYLTEQEGYQVFATKRWNSSGTSLAECARPPLVLDCDIQSLTNVLQVMADVKPEHVFVSAADISIRASVMAPDRTLCNNVLGVLNVLEAAKRLNPQPRLVVVGSCEVYGQVFEHELPVQEEQTFRPQNTYAVSKAAQDLLAFQYSRSFRMEIIRTRTFNYTGAGQSDLYVCSSFAKQIAEIEAGLRPPRISVGNLGVKRDFLDVKDLGPAYHALALQGRPGEAYNVCSSRMVSIEEILDTLIRQSGLRIEVIVDQEKLRRTDNMLLCGDRTKIREHTGWEPSGSLDQTLKDLLEWWRSRTQHGPALSMATSPRGGNAE